MKDYVKYGDEGEKNFGCVADELTPYAVLLFSTA